MPVVRGTPEEELAICTVERARLLRELDSLQDVIEGLTPVRPLRFTVHAKPVPKARPRLGRGGHVYTPARTQAFEQVLAWTARQAILVQGWQCTAEPVYVILRFCHAPARADCDNLAKACLDGMNGIVYEDDHQVRSLIVTLDQDATTAGVEIEVGLMRSAPAARRRQEG